jgi:cytidylate kinase
MSHIHKASRVAFPWPIFALGNARTGNLGKTAKALRFTITLSREAGTEAAEIAREVGPTLAWAVYDHALLERIALDTGVRINLLEGVDEHHRTWFKEAIDGMFGVPAVSEPAYVHHLVRTVLTLGSRGECVIVGRGAAFILPACSTFRVRLVAPIEHRIATLSQRLGIGQADAGKKIVALDTERVALVRDYFRRDSRDPIGYDLVLNTARFSVVECAEFIVAGLNRWQARSSASDHESSIN